MSVTTNIISRYKALLYGAGNSDTVDTAFNKMSDFHLFIQLPNGADGNVVAAAANSFVVFTVPVNARLVGANMVTRAALVNTNGMDVVVTVSVNGVSCATYSTDADAGNGAAAANAVCAFTMTTGNAYIDAGEVGKVVYTMEDNTNNYLDGILTLDFRPV